MKRIRTKEIILYVLGILFCKVEIADCYPLIPAYFTALYISMESRWLTLGACFVGMACFLPVTQLTKYGVAMAGIILIIHLIEWVDKNCRARYAAVTAGAVTTLISLGGNLLSVKGRGYITTSILEGIFIFAVVSLGCRATYVGRMAKRSWRSQKKKIGKSNVY